MYSSGQRGERIIPCSVSLLPLRLQRRQRYQRLQRRMSDPFGHDENPDQLLAPSRQPYATLLAFLRLLLLTPETPRERQRRRASRKIRRRDLCAVGDTLRVPDTDQGLAGPLDIFAPTCPLLPRQVARPAYQQSWKLQRKHTAAFHTCWLTAASIPPCPAVPS